MTTKLFFTLLTGICCMYTFAQEFTVSGPNKNLQVKIVLQQSGILNYSVVYNDKVMLEDSPLGLVTNVADFSKNLSYVSHTENVLDETYTIDRAKTSNINYKASEIVITLQNQNQQQFNVVFRVGNNDIAFKYELQQYGETASLIVEKEVTGFDFPQQTTTFLTPQATPMIGWKRTKPSYEEEYIADGKLGAPSKYGVGYTFPGLFRIGDNGWVLVSETGVNGAYCGAKLSEGTVAGLYTIAFPESGENNGLGNVSPGFALPGATPWRTLTIGENLKPIVETTVAFDVVKPLYKPSTTYKYGRSVWSWIMWQDHSVNYDDQIEYIDLAANMGYEFSLVDGLWDKQIGRDKLEKIAEYAQSKNVGLFVWYNSNGYWNDAPQGPKQRMNTAIARQEEMAWLQKMGVKGIKVDFFGGDKQKTMQLYEDILSDANRFGLMVIFHGCTLPRGWERMYPNYVGSEAVLASENLIFTQHANDNEAFNACLHPFIRNAVGSMEFGPVLLNKRHNRTNDGGTTRRTTDIFQLATSILFQNPVQMFALAPNNLHDVPEFEIDFMKKVPTTWDETRFIDGYPGKYVVLARRHQYTWYVVALNAQDKTIELKVNLDMFANLDVNEYYDDSARKSKLRQTKVSKKGAVVLTVQPNGAVILTN
ncbi:MAG: glycoside hydrolase family 97 catalytic domain-containing protein [Flavobacteriaceae bacterium]